MQAFGLMWLSAVSWAVLAPPCDAGQPDGYQWFGIWLHPAQAYRSQASAADGAVPSGQVDVDGAEAAVWPEWTTEFVSLLPDGAARAAVEGADGGYQAGFVIVAVNEAYPALWQGSAESVVDMTPEGPYIGSSLYGRRGVQTVGYAYHRTDGSHAAVWLNNDPDQFVDLHHASADWSSAHATDGQWQGGEAAFLGFGLRAALWKGTPQSFLVMGPADYRDGLIRGMAPGTQVGTYTDLTTRAVLWHDTPESWVRMTPSWSYSARLYATTGDMHVGWSDRTGVYSAHAGVWFGDDPDSFFDLHPFVPPEYADAGSTAYDIDTKDGNIYIAGSVNSGGQGHAFLWVGVPLDTGDGGGGPKSPGGLTKVRKP
ncbi:MAG: hypothetical protein IT431_12970 [Phycisphaerales bacterium]|nr:hypothetical protein [Phycisphaerales bacterium]